LHNYRIWWPLLNLRSFTSIRFPLILNIFRPSFLLKFPKFFPKLRGRIRWIAFGQILKHARKPEILPPYE
jgi:hypothetical protein